LHRVARGRQQALALGAQAQAAARALGQHLADAGLQRGELHRQGRGAAVQRVGRTAQGAVVGNGHQGLELAQIGAHAISGILK
jgi:hypothetical protein